MVKKNAYVVFVGYYIYEVGRIRCRVSFNVEEVLMLLTDLYVTQLTSFDDIFISHLRNLKR